MAPTLGAPLQPKGANGGFLEEAAGDSNRGYAAGSSRRYFFEFNYFARSDLSEVSWVDRGAEVNASAAPGNALPKAACLYSLGSRACY